MTTRPAMEQIADDLPLNLDVADYECRPLDAIQYLVVHHTQAGPMLPPQVIARRHIERMQWPGMGYHYYIQGDGRIHQCERLGTASYHTRNRNYISVGIAFAGDFNTAVPPAGQIAAGAGLLAWLIEKLNLQPAAVVGHCELLQFRTACPGDQWLMGAGWKESLMAAVMERLPPMVAETSPQGSLLAAPGQAHSRCRPASQPGALARRPSPAP